MKIKRVYILILGVLLVFFPYLSISADENDLTVINTPIANQKQLQEVINSLGASGGEIWLSQDIALRSTLYFPQDNSVTIDGRGHRLTMDEGVESRHISISSANNKITLKNMTLAGNGHGNVGGGLSVNGRVDLEKCVIENNFAPNGGGLIIAGGSVVMKDCDIRGNGSNGYGGGVHLSSNGVLAAYDSRFSANRATRGGAVFATGGVSSEYTLYSEDTEYKQNKAEGSGNDIVMGGAIAAEGENTGIKLLNSRLVDNTSANIAGGVYAGGMLETLNTDFEGNSADGNGGGIYVAYKALLSGGSVSGNASKASGGGMFVDIKALKHFCIKDAGFNGNSSSVYVNWDTGAYTDETSELYSLLLSTETVSVTEYTKMDGGEANVFNDADINIMAKCNITFSAGGGQWEDGSSANRVEACYLGDLLKMPDGLSKDGQSPVGWKIGSSVARDYRVSGPATLLPIWEGELDELAVEQPDDDRQADSGKAAEGESDGEQPSESAEPQPEPTYYEVVYTLEGSTATRRETIVEGGKLNEPIVHYDGYKLKGWYIPGTDVKWDFNKDTISGDMELQARWDKQ